MKKESALVSRLHPAFDYGHQIVENSSNNETVLGSGRKQGGAVENLIDGSEKLICRLTFQIGEFRVRILLKGAVRDIQLWKGYILNLLKNNFTYFLYIFICLFVC